MVKVILKVGAFVGDRLSVKIWYFADYGLAGGLVDNPSDTLSYVGVSGSTGSTLEM
jgi:hypothetical protein